jgi:Putative zinc-finger
MNCTFAEKVSALIDGELVGDELLAVERHLVACNECQQLRADFMSLSSEISSYPLPALPSVQPRLAERLASPETSSRASFIDLLIAAFQGGHRQAILAAAAVLLIVLGLAVWLSMRSSRQGSATDQVANANTNSSKRKPAPPPAASPQPSKPPKVEDRETDDAPAVPRKFRLPEAITALPAKRLRAPQTSAPPEIAVEPTSPVIANNLDSTNVGPADTESLTQHVEQSALLLRSFRNLRPRSTGNDEIGHERRRAQKLFYQNVMLRREADSSGDIEVASLLQSLEPILLDIANLPQDAPHSEVRAIKDRVERQNLVAMLQINSRAQGSPNR